MSFLRAVVIAFVWSFFGLMLISKGLEVSNDVQILTTSIVVAGALAGGDKSK